MPAQARPDPAGDRLVLMVGDVRGGVYGLGGNRGRDSLRYFGRHVRSPECSTYYEH
jgi:hypothetical protein